MSLAPSVVLRGRLLHKYVVVFVCLVGGVLMASSLVELYFAYQATKGAIVREERAAAVATAAKIEEFARDIERRVREITQAASDDPAAAQLGLGKLAFRGELGAALAEQRELDFLRLMRDVPAISELSHLDVSGKEQLRVARLALDAVGSQQDFSQAPKFRETRSSKTHWSPVYFRSGVQPYLTLAVPVGQYAVEVTTAEISLKPVQRAIAQVQVGRGGYAYVVDSRNRLFAHPDVGLVRQNRDLSGLPQVRDARAATSTAQDAAVVAEGLQGGQILAAHATIPSLEWVVVVERPLADAYAPLRAPIIRSVIIFLLGLGLSILASVLLARRMVAPIRMLQEGASRIGAGDLGHRVHVATGDELEALGNELNRTAGQLEESYATLENRVKERTRELAQANTELTESLEQQTATGEILRVISSSPTDVQPVFDTIAQSAARLCEAEFGFVFRFEGEQLHFISHHGLTPEGHQAIRQAFPRLANRGTAAGRAVLNREVSHIPDVQAEPGYDLGPTAELAAFRSTVGVPMLRDGITLGAITISRTRSGPFPDRQIALLKTFADQAVIAIENVRLFTEVQARNRDLTEALERQMATSEVLKVISRSAFDLQPVLEVLAENATRLCAADWCLVYRFDGEALQVVAHYGAPPELIASFSAGGQGAKLYPGRGSVTGRAAASRQTVHIPDVLADPHYENPDAQRHGGFRAALGVPMLRDGNLLGVFFLSRNRPLPFTGDQIELVTTFADQAVIAIENVRLFTELESRNRDLIETLEQQTATAEILQAISSSPTDIQPVLDTVVRAAARFCAAPDVVLLRLDGTSLRGAAGTGPFHEVIIGQLGSLAALEFPVTRGSVTGRAVVDRSTVHVPDLAAVSEDEFPEGRALQRSFGHRTTAGTPLLREGSPIGAIALFRMNVEPFSDRQLGLLRLFADQAVIAIENVRLFTALEARNKDLTETLEQQTATAEILRVISSSPTDVQPVFDTIAESAVRLCEAEVATVTRFDGEWVHIGAIYGPSAEGVDALRHTFPMRPSGAGGAARAIRDRATVHIPDVLEDEHYRIQGAALTAGFRAVLGVPMLREGQAIGAITLGRAQAGPYGDTQIKLLRTFADQAVIAIENVRLFKELEARNQDLTETLEQQTATGEILRVISSSPTDVQPVFDTIAERALHLCGASSSGVLRYDGEFVDIAALANVSPEGGAALRSTFPMRPSLGSGSARAILTGAIVHIPDNRAEPGYQIATQAQAGGFRSVLSVPMLREGQAIGTLTVGRPEPGLFSDRQVALLKTFADQAVIAVENVRLFTELEAKNRDLTETLEQQTATSEVLKVISRSTSDLQPVFDTLAANAVRLCAAERAFIYRFDGQLLKMAASYNAPPELTEAVRQTPLSPGRQSASSRAALERRTVHIPDAQADPEYTYVAGQVSQPVRTVLSVPMLAGNALVGILTIFKLEVRPFTDKQIALVETFADQAVIAIENVRLFTELEARNRDLTETLEQQTATGEILRVISGSPTDVQPVFDTIARRARRLCEAVSCQVFRFEDGQLHFTADDGHAAEALVVARRAFPRPPDRGSCGGRAILDARVAEIPDVAADPEYTLGEVAQAMTYRGVVGVPMLRDGQPIGVICVNRSDPGRFTGRQIELLKTFADQAVIAVENVRLFLELEARNKDLTETLEQQTATSEVLKVISRSAFDLQPVLQALIENATRLCGADGGTIYRFDGELLRMSAAYNMPAELRAFVEQNPLPPGRGTAVGRSLIEGRVVHIHDALADPEYTYAAAPIGGYRTLLGVPMLRDGVSIGVFSVYRMRVTPFTDRQIELVTTFADQGAIAIENVRLFQALEVRNRDLTETLEQQTATGEVLRVISASPTDVQPVFDTIARNAARLCEAQFCFVYRFDGQLLHFVAHHGVTEEGAATVRRAFPAPPSRGSAAARAVLDRDVVQIPDVHADPNFALGVTATTAGYRSAIGVPMLRDGLPIGSIAVARSQAGLLPERQVELLKTFADQAVIAIENVRLFQELDTRTQELTRSVGELRALGEVSRAVSSTLDLDAVLETIVSRAVELSGSYSGIIYEFDEPTQSFRARASHNLTPEYLDVLRASPIHLGEGAMGRAGALREPVEVTDVQSDDQTVAPQVRVPLAQQGVRSLLAVPLVREDKLLGGLVVLRRERGGFSSGVAATLQTFAAQSVLAIHNAGLFREIQRQKQYSEALVATSPVAIVTMDLDGHVMSWNPGAQRLFGYTPSEALGRTMEELVATPEVREEVRANIKQTLGGESVRAIGRRARQDGSLVDVEISSMPVVLDGAKVGMIGIYHDITELLRARREAETANEAKSAFLATMSHEIRTPLNAVIGMSGLLLNTPLADEQREYAEIVRQSGDALLTVINDILDFSKIEAGRLELEAQPFDLRECVEGALDLVATRAAEKGLDLAYLVGDGTPAAIVGDVTRLRQVLLNLLSNAVKFTERGEVVLSVSARHLGGPEELHELTFSVRDTGIGIPADRLGRLFQSFSQVDASTTRRYGGTGLGLAISQRLAELMGGRIGVTSEVGLGSEFRFSIRAAAAVDAPLPSRRDLSGVQPSLRGKRVLVVDDNATNRRIVTTHLGNWGLPARATESPREALAWIRAGEPFDVAILDMHMPEMDGATLAHAIREEPAGAALPLILFTSLGRREALAESEAFAAYLHKPIKPSQLFDALVSVLGDQPVHVPERGVRRSELDAQMAGRHPLRILLAEDNVVNQKVAMRLLGQLGYRADLAANGLEAIDAVGRQAYDIVLMDVQMPELDGFEASREINRRWPGTARPRIVAMTANAMQGDRELCMAAGMDDYVAKPIRVEELVAALERVPRRPDAVPRGGPGAPKPGDGSREAGLPRRLEPAAAGAIARGVLDRLTASMGQAFAAELIDTFVDDARDLVGGLRRALTGSDVDAFRRAAHSLKSTAETVGATLLGALARELETQARTGSLDNVGDRLDRLADEYERAARALGELRRDLIR